MIKTKLKGSRQERKVKKILENQGYICLKSAASLGIFDLICFNGREIRFIQVKSNYCPLKEKKKIERFKVIPINGQKEIWIFKNYHKEPIIEIIKEGNP